MQSESETPADVDVSLSMRLWAKVSGSNLRVNRWRKESRAIHDKVEANILYSTSKEYNAFEQRYRNLQTGLEAYDKSLRSGEWKTVWGLSTVVYVRGHEVLQSGESVSSNAARLKENCARTHQNHQKIGGRCTLCFGDDLDIGSLIFRSSLQVVRELGEDDSPSLSAPNHGERNPASMAHDLGASSSRATVTSAVNRSLGASTTTAAADIAAHGGEGQEPSSSDAASSSAALRPTKTQKTRILPGKAIVETEEMTVYADSGKTIIEWHKF
ncbi:hypothetical protein B0H16DRAFT_1531248 [Mycena metata]|uniref:Uncharacterized protein n=1 Tax=Mycena metata TaxID=1033252 RepID=A0AAD7JD06_9AGAR|nr:hypothetical protein B0H16DRAFT_1531248 [Mycena metata]